MSEIEKREVTPEEPFDNRYPWLVATFAQILADELCARKPMYVWGAVQAAALAKVLGITQISIIEFGVAGGFGLLSLERTSELVENKTGIRIDVYGFDTGHGLPKPQDYRDQPNMWVQGQLPMNRSVLEKKLRNSSLRIGPVKETVPQFLEGKPPAVAFVSFDLDLYTSTRDALTLLAAEHESLLPRVVCYFDDIMGHTYNDFAGERLAIAEFNEQHSMRKLSPNYGLRYFLPQQFAHDRYWDCFYLAHLFEHPLYNQLDSLNKVVFWDDNGVQYKFPGDSNWRSKVPL